jgi:hypothetical protein
MKAIDSSFCDVWKGSQRYGTLHLPLEEIIAPITPSNRNVYCDKPSESGLREETGFEAE